jgi:segregation and condensation protein B
MELGFVEIGGRSESVGKPLLYRSTELFMDKFGLSSLDDLPTLREMEELLNDPSFSSEKAHLLMKRGLDLPDDEEEQLNLKLVVSTEATTAIEIADPSDILSETADASSGDGAPSDADLDRTNLSGGADSDSDVN